MKGTNLEKGWDVIFCFLKGQETERRPPTNQRWGWIELLVPSVSVYSTLKQTHHYGVYLFPFVMSQRGDFQDKHMLSEKLTRKRSEVWLFSFTGRFDTLAFLAVASFIFAHLFAQLVETTFVMSVVWRPFFVSGWAKLGISIQNYELWFVTVSIFRPTVKQVVETNGATSAEVCAIPLLCKMNFTWIHSCLCSTHQTGKVDPHQPRVSGHRGNVLDIKWNPFNDYIIASCSEDSTVRAPPECFTHLLSFSPEYEHVAAGR